MAYFETQLSSVWSTEGLGWRIVIVTLWTYQCVIEMAQIMNQGLIGHFRSMWNWVSAFSLYLNAFIMIELTFRILDLGYLKRCAAINCLLLWF